jgi:hypothetical protein
LDTEPISPQPFPHQLAYEHGVRVAAGPAHHLADEEAETPVWPAWYVGFGAGVAHRAQAAALHNLCGAAAAARHVRQHRFAARAADGARRGVHARLTHVGSHRCLPYMISLCLRFSSVKLQVPSLSDLGHAGEEGFMNASSHIAASAASSEVPHAPTSPLTQFRSVLLRYRFIVLALLIVIGGGLLMFFHTRLPEPEFARDLGIALFTAGTVGLGVEFYIRREFESLVTDRLTEALETSSLTSRLDAMRDALSLSKEVTKMGLRKVHRKRHVINFETFLEQAEPGSEIRLLGVCLIGFTDHKMQEALRRKLNEGCTIRLLVLSPNSQFARYRGLEDLSPGTVSPEADGDELDETVQEIAMADKRHQIFMRHLPEPLRGNIMIGHYDAPAHVLIVGIDKAMVVGFYLRGQRGEMFPHVELEVRQGGIYQPFMDHFNALWDTRIEIRGDPAAAN